MTTALREILTALTVGVCILVGVVLVWRENRAERKRQERLARGVDEELERQRRMRTGRG